MLFVEKWARGSRISSRSRGRQFPRCRIRMVGWGANNCFFTVGNAYPQVLVYDSYPRYSTPDGPITLVIVSFVCLERNHGGDTEHGNALSELVPEGKCSPVVKWKDPKSVVDRAGS